MRVSLYAVILEYLSEYYSWTKIVSSVRKFLKCSFDNMSIGFVLKSIHKITKANNKVKKEQPTRALVQSLFCVYAPMPKKVAALFSYFLHCATAHTFVSKYSVSQVNIVINMVIRTLLRVTCLPVEAGTADAGSVSVRILQFCVYTLVPQNVTNEFSFFFPIRLPVHFSVCAAILTRIFH